MARSISARSGAVAGPGRVTEIAAATLARYSASGTAVPAVRSARKTPVWVSPAPVVSTASTVRAGTCVTAARPGQAVEGAPVRPVPDHQQRVLAQRVPAPDLGVPGRGAAAPARAEQPGLALVDGQDGYPAQHPVPGRRRDVEDERARVEQHRQVVRERADPPDERVDGPGVGEVVARQRDHVAG